MSVKFPSELGHRATVLVTDKLLIHNISTGATEYTTVAELLAAFGIAIDAAFTGIGIAAALARLHTYAAGTNEFRVESGGGSSVVRFIVANDFDTYIQWNSGTTAGDFLFYDTRTGVIRARIDRLGRVCIGSVAPTSALQVPGLPVYANNAAAVGGGLTAGAFYRTNADPDPVCVVH